MARQTEAKNPPIHRFVLRALLFLSSIKMSSVHLLADRRRSRFSTEAECQRLRRTVADLDDLPPQLKWNQVSSRMKARSARECRARAFGLKQPRRLWTYEEDVALRELISTFQDVPPDRFWTEIARRMEPRSAIQCRKHWVRLCQDSAGAADKKLWKAYTYILY
eukprot:SAG31_NODE_13466_length_867_cov_1.194010_1_plen_164_part_00